MFYLKICFIEVLFSNTSQTCLILCKRFSISLMLSANLLWNMKHSKRSLKFEIPDKSNRNCSGISRGTSTALSLWALIMANSSEKKEKKLVKFSFTKTFLNLARFWQKKLLFSIIKHTGSGLVGLHWTQCIKVDHRIIKVVDTIFQLVNFQMLWFNEDANILQKNKQINSWNWNSQFFVMSYNFSEY